MRLLRKPEVESKVGMCERAIRDLERQGLFPKRVLINPNNGRAVAWDEQAVDSWIAERIAASRVAA